MATAGDQHEQMRLILDGGTTLGLGPAELLDRFRADRDEAAFGAIVARHGPMVLATCRRILPRRADADDAFQATFLILARKAGTVQDADRLAPWLHRVARRAAVRARSLAARRRAVEGAPEGEVAVAPPHDDLAELRAVLDEELARLPEKYRAPLVLCYLEGLTHDEAAGQLAWPVGTVRSRLAGGRDRLRSRLARRGFAPAVLAVLSPTTLPSAAVSRFLQAATLRLVFTSATKPAASSIAAVLAQGVLTSMFLTQVQTVTIATLALALPLAAGTTAVVAHQQAADSRPGERDIRRDQERRSALKQEFNILARRFEQMSFDWAVHGEPLKKQLAEKEEEIRSLELSIRRKLAQPPVGPPFALIKPTPAALDDPPAPLFTRIDYADPNRYLVLHPSFGDSDHIRQLAAPLRADSAEETLDQISRWISKTLKYDANAAYEYRDVDAACRARVYGGCADHAIVFTALARACGIPAVFVKTMDAAWIREFRTTGTCEVWSGHVFLEVFIKGKWRLLDASAMQLYDDYTPSSRILPGNRYAYDKGSDPRELVLSPDWERWKRQTAAYFARFNLDELPVGSGRELASTDDVYIAADSPIWQALTNRCQTLGLRARFSFNTDYATTLPKVRGKILIVTSVGDHVVPPANRYGAYLPLSAAEIHQRIERDGAGVARKQLDDGTRLVLLYARDVAGLLKLVETWELGAGH